MPKAPALPTTVRPLHMIASEILGDPALKGDAKTFAQPYLDAMRSLRTTEDRYGEDGGVNIVIYALSNLAHYRGETARRVKAELKAHVAGAPLA